MTDMLVKLYDLPPHEGLIDELRQKGIIIKRAMSADKHRVVDFVSTRFSDNWRNECECTFASLPVKTFVAVKDKQIIGFASYDSIAKNFFGPTGVDENYRGLGIGKALLLAALHAMKEDGYGYCIIGWVVEALEFYKKTVGAIPIENSFPGVYRGLIAME